jgi:hypothetical protein
MPAEKILILQFIASKLIFTTSKDKYNTCRISSSLCVYINPLRGNSIKSVNIIEGHSEDLS